ncbi:hypothetical protein BKA82DRAFT_2383961 [Pisolithus tinctorius]|nr:hypothetical protein BKA82DRAFT_2383961 [Pisolithus tinctorius]
MRDWMRCLLLEVTVVLYVFQVTRPEAARCMTPESGLPFLLHPLFPMESIDWTVLPKVTETNDDGFTDFDSTP